MITTNPLTWISPTTMHSLGWALLHFLWQGTALAALAAATMALCRRSSARHVVAVGALLLMLLAPIATFFYVQPHSGVADARNAPSFAAEVRAITRRAAATSGTIQTSRIAPSLDAFPWLVEGWLLGVAFFSLRTAGGFVLLERERRKRSSVVSERVLEICYNLQDQLGIRRAIRYCECKWLQAPAVVGWFRPIVFLPVTALTGLSEEQLQLVIAHELAHIRRFDPFVNVFQVCVETLLFYHPAVWWLNKKIRAEREHCCDEMAVDLCGNAVEYARALTLMEEWRSAPVFAMAANRGPLTERILRVLGLKTFGAGMRGIGLATSLLCLGTALIAGNTLLGIAHPKSVRAGFFLQSEPSSQNVATPRPEPQSKPSSKPSAGQSARSESSPSASSYIDGMKAAGLGDLSVDELIALKTQDVTPEYVHEMQKEGVSPDAHKLIAMRVQDVTPEYIREFHEAGLQPDDDHLIALRVQGADAKYYSAIKQAGIDPDVDHLISMKVQGVTPEYVREMRAAGLAANADQIISLKVQDVTPEYLKNMHDLGIDLNGNSAVSMRVQDVTPEYVKEMRGLGLKLSANELISMRVQDVTPQYVHEMQSLGLQPSTNELVSMRVQDVTPEYVKALQAAGFKVGVNDIIRAKVQDVTPEFIERARQHGFQNLTLDKLIRLRELGILDSKADI